MPDQSVVSPAERENIHLLQRDVLEAVAVGRPLAQVMDLMCRRVESLAPELVCTVLRIDKAGRLRPCAAGMSPEINAAIDGEPIGPSQGSCGTAAFRGEPVEVVDIATDPLWEGYRKFALDLGLAACWSSPVKGRDGKVAATFAIYYRECRSASTFHREMVEACVHLCSIAIQNDEAKSTIDRLAYYDQLTGLPNRVLFADRADVALASATQDGEPLAIMFIDVDRFKTINDSLGHPIGDRVLQEIARRLRRAVGNTDTLCRLGGDEFALLLQHQAGAQSADTAARLQDVLRQPLEIDGRTLALNASLGISVFPEDANTFEGLLKNAEVAMYQAKAGGRNCFRFFKSEMDDAATHRLEFESAIRSAIQNCELVLHFQPKVTLDTNTVCGVEALVRWDRPQMGQVSPDRFIPLAEECGLVNDIDTWVLEEACRQLAAWDKEGVAVPAMAVNVSATDFQHGEVPRRVAAALARHDLAGGRLILEITESLMMKHSDETQRTFAALRATGVRLSVDDFGTGYSSLSYLKRFAVNELKLDRSFVNDLESDLGDQALAIAVIRIGQSLGLSVVAEGVETAAQLDFLRNANCHIAQGFLFSGALPAGEFVAWLKQFQGALAT